MSRGRRLALRVLAATLALLALIAARVFVESARELRAADVATAEGDLPNTMVHLRRAARWHAPLNPACHEALKRLQRLAEQAEATGDMPTALYAWRAIRGSSVAAESLFTPHEDETDLAEEHLAALMARVDPPQIDMGDDVAQREARYLAALRDHGRPNRFALVLAWLGLALFVAGLGNVAVGGFDVEDRPLRHALGRHAAIGAGGLLLLLTGLALA